MLTKKYAEEFNYTDTHISKYQNEKYAILIYKNKITECFLDLNIYQPQIDFGSCYDKVLNHYGLTPNQNLIIAIIDKLPPNNTKNNFYYNNNKDENSFKNSLTSYAFFHPVTGELLDSSFICTEDVIILQESLNSILP